MANNTNQNDYEKQKVESFLEEYYANNPKYTQDVYIRAIANAANKAALELDVEIVQINDDMINAAMTTSKKGLVVGVGSQKTRTTLKVYDNGAKSFKVDMHGQEVDSFKLNVYGASLKTFAGGERSVGLKLDLKDAANELSLSNRASNKSNAEIDAQIAETIAKNERIRTFNEQAEQLQQSLRQHNQVLFQVEYLELADLSHQSGLEPADFTYPKRKMPDAPRAFLNQAYARSIALPDDFEFLNTGDVDEHPSIKDEPDREKKALARISVLNDHIHSVMANIKYTDPSNENVQAYEKAHGEVRDVTDKEAARIDLINRSSTITGNKIFVPSIDFKSIHEGSEAAIVSGQVFTGSKKRTPKNMSLTDTVNLVSGDPTKDVDAYMVIEGVGTGARSKEVVSKSEQFRGLNVVVLAAFNDKNFINIMEAAYQANPDTTIMGIADNDLKVRMKTDRRPILTDGHYTYIGKNDMDITEQQLKDEPDAIESLLKNNAGAAAAKRLNKYFLDNPPRNEQGQITPIKAAAFVVNKGEGLTDYLFKPQSPNVNGDRPANSQEALLSPKVDFDDLVGQFKKVHAQEIKNVQAKIEAGTPASHNEFTKIRKVDDHIAQKFLNDPFKKVLNTLNEYRIKRVDAGYYDEKAVAQRAQKEQEFKAESYANDSTSKASNDEILTNKYDAAIQKSQALVDRLASPNRSNAILASLTSVAKNTTEPELKQEHSATLNAPAYRPSMP